MGSRRNGTGRRPVGRRRVGKRVRCPRPPRGRENEAGKESTARRRRRCADRQIGLRERRCTRTNRLREARGWTRRSAEMCGLRSPHLSRIRRGWGYPVSFVPLLAGLPRPGSRPTPGSGRDRSCPPRPPRLAPCVSTPSRAADEPAASAAEPRCSTPAGRKRRRPADLPAAPPARQPPLVGGHRAWAAGRPRGPRIPPDGLPRNTLKAVIKAGHKCSGWSSCGAGCRPLMWAPGTAVVD